MDSTVYLHHYHDYTLPVRQDFRLAWFRHIDPRANQWLREEVGNIECSWRSLHRDDSLVHQGKFGSALVSPNVSKPFRIALQDRWMIWLSSRFNLRYNYAVRAVAVYLALTYFVMLIAFFYGWCRPFSDYLELVPANRESNAAYLLRGARYILDN